MQHITKVENYQAPAEQSRRKEAAKHMSHVHDWAGFKRLAERMEKCGTEPVFGVDSESGKRLLLADNFCMARLCPQCAFHRSQKVFGQVSKIMDELNNSHAYIFLTLTVKNCSGPELKPTLDKLFKGYTTLIKRTLFKPFKGWFRGLEITYNRNENTYHPHFHVILAVRPSYFKASEYVCQAAMRNAWREVMQLDYDPVIDMRRVKVEADGTISGAVKEVAKYTVKTSELLTPDDLQAAIEPVRILVPALAGRRLVAFGGVMRDLHKRLNLDDPTDGDLSEANEVRPDVTYIIERYRWGIGGVMDWLLVADNERMSGADIIAAKKERSGSYRFPKRTDYDANAVLMQDRFGKHLDKSNRRDMVIKGLTDESPLPDGWED